MHRRLSPTASVRRSALSATTAPTMIPHSLQESPLMWVFGYGSLMWDQWEQQFGGSHVDGASLMSYRRSFNKASTRNWGTRNSPGPCGCRKLHPGVRRLDFADSDGPISGMRHRELEITPR